MNESSFCEDERMSPLKPEYILLSSPDTTMILNSLEDRELRPPLMLEPLKPRKDAVAS